MEELRKKIQEAIKRALEGKNEVVGKKEESKDIKVLEDKELEDFVFNLDISGVVISDLEGKPLRYFLKEENLKEHVQLIAESSAVVYMSMLSVALDTGMEQLRYVSLITDSHYMIVFGEGGMIFSLISRSKNLGRLYLIARELIRKIKF